MTTMTTEFCTTCGNEGNCPDCGVWHTEDARQYRAAFEAAQAAPVTTAPVEVYEAHEYEFKPTPAEIAMGEEAEADEAERRERRAAPVDETGDIEYQPIPAEYYGVDDSGGAAIVADDETDWEAQDAYNAQWGRDNTEAAYVATLADKGTQLATGRDAKIDDAPVSPLDPATDDYQVGYQDAINGKPMGGNRSLSYYDGYEASHADADAPDQRPDIVRRLADAGLSLNSTRPTQTEQDVIMALIDAADEIIRLRAELAAAQRTDRNARAVFDVIFSMPLDDINAVRRNLNDLYQEIYGAAQS